MKTVLAVVSSWEIANHLYTSLEDTSFSCLCTTWQKAASFLPAQPDVLILELCLPGCTGLDFLADNRDRLPPVVLALSTFTSRNVMEEAAAAGVTGMLRIPFPRREILRRLEEACKKIPPFREGKDCQKVTPYETRFT